MSSLDNQRNDHYSTAQNAYHHRQQNQQFACLFTRHKTQKRKVWNDGRLVVRGCMLQLHAACPVPGSGDRTLDRVEVNRSQLSNLQDLEMENHLVRVEGPWTGCSSTTAIDTSTAAPLVSSGMKKVFSRKFRKPSQCVPPPRQAPQQQPALKRRRPLQPGELQRQYHGETAIARTQDATQQYHRTSQPPFQPQNHGQHPSAGSPTSHSNRLRQSFALDPPGGQRRDQFPCRNAPPFIGRPNSQQTSRPSHNFGAATEHGDDQRNQAPPISPSHKNSTTEASVLWTGNGFDPASFYGEEEEEEDGPEGEPEAFSTASLVTTASSAPANQTTATLSTSELLSLFGGEVSENKEPQDTVPLHTNEICINGNTDDHDLADQEAARERLMGVFGIPVDKTNQKASDDDDADQYPSAPIKPASESETRKDATPFHDEFVLPASQGSASTNGE